MTRPLRITRYNKKGLELIKPKMAGKLTSRRPWASLYSLCNTFSSVQFISVDQSCPTLCDPMNCSMTGLPVYHQLPEFTQTHGHRVGDAIQPSHPLSSPSPPAPNPSRHQGLSKESTLRMINETWQFQGQRKRSKCRQQPNFWKFLLLLHNRYLSYSLAYEVTQPIKTNPHSPGPLSPSETDSI